MNYRANILAHWAATDGATRAAGQAWYAEAAREARAIARILPNGSGFVAAAAIIAALSPRCTWAVNVRWARAIAEAAARGDAEAPAVHTGSQRTKAWRIANGENPFTVLSGPKERPFWRNIAGDAQQVTVDVWAARAAGWEKTNLPERERAAIEAAYMSAADHVDVPPSELQAAIWLHVRGDRADDPAAFTVANRRS